MRATASSKSGVAVKTGEKRIAGPHAATLAPKSSSSGYFGGCTGISSAKGSSPAAMREIIGSAHGGGVRVALSTNGPEARMTEQGESIGRILYVATTTVQKVGGVSTTYYKAIDWRRRTRGAAIAGYEVLGAAPFNL